MDRPAEQGVRPRPRLSSRSRAWLPSLVCLAGALTAIAMIWLVDVRTNSDRTRRSVAAGLEDVRQAANQLAVEWEARLALVEALHDQARAVLRTPPDSAARRDALAALRATVARRDAGIDVVSAIGPDGSLLFTTGAIPDPPPRFAERSYFRAIFEEHRQSFVGMPANGLVTGRRDVPFAEAFHDDQGATAALTVVSVPTSVLQSMKRYFDNPGVTTVTLLRDDGAVLARQPMPEGMVQLPQSGSAFSAARETGFGTTRKVSIQDGVMRYYAARRVEDTDLFVIVAIDEEAVLATARLEQVQTDRWAIALSLASLLIAGAAAIIWHWRRRTTLRQIRMQARLDRLDLLNHIAGEATDMIALLDAQLRYV